ncbi:MAG TPA: hypothetical protein VF174_16520 [Micromonosporaceae bacterium]
MTDQTGPLSAQEPSSTDHPPSQPEPDPATGASGTPPEQPTIPQQSGSPDSAVTPPATPPRPGTHLPKWVPWAIAALVTVIIVLVATVVALIGGGEDTEPVADTTPAAGAPAPTRAARTTQPPPITYYTPTKDDFTLDVKILKKECFGSAGCNITYRIEVAYSGGTLDPYKTYEVTYEVKGAEDPIVNTLEVTGDMASVEQEERAGTRRSSDKLTAVVTDVSEL